MTIELSTMDESRMANFQPVISAYNEAKIEQMKKFDPVFYDKCVSILPSEEELDSKPIDATCYLAQLLTDSELKIVNIYTIKDLLEKQLSKELSALGIAKAFIKASIVAQLTTNCVLQFLIPQALQKAVELDEYLQSNGTLIGPMHGIPISLKEHLDYEGEVTHASYVALMDNVSEKTAITSQIFGKQGAIFHVRTSQPQAIMHLDTWNVISGRTRNPRSTKLSPGGSSGGESAMVGMHGSIMGVGTDIGGSIRSPAAFVGLYGMRPTAKRSSLLNTTPSMTGQESIVPTIGPIARSIDELNYYMEHYINDGKPWKYDPTVVPLPWKTVELPKKIRIGVLFSDNLVTPYPAVTRALNTIAQELKDQHCETFEVVDLAPYWFSEDEMTEIFNTNLVLYTIDGNKGQFEIFAKSGEPILPLTKHYFEFGGGKSLDAYENRRYNAIRDVNQLKVFEKFFSSSADSLNLDFILSPTYVGPAELPGNSLYWGYTSFWNLFDYPNVIFPSGISHSPSLDAKIDESTLKSNKYEKSVWYDVNGKLRYNSEEYVNGPVGLQLTGRRFEDESVVAAVKKITEALKIERQ